ncbi:MAG: Spy/CpxP family protein refolding chaperone [Methylotetracoccus sp.]|nr:Spy/CpxP family protein refolding chaperone [Methylotetracoccus sp.]
MMPLEAKTVPFALAVAGLLASPTVGAAPPESTARAPTHREAAGLENVAERRAEFLASRLETLQTALKLRPDQEQAWKKWSASITAAQPDWKEKHPGTASLAKLPVPDRLEKMVEFARERLARLEERLAATKIFYAVLSPEQRQTFDKDFNLWPHAGRSGKPGQPGKRPGSLIAPRIGSQ